MVFSLHHDVKVGCRDSVAGNRWSVLPINFQQQNLFQHPFNPYNTAHKKSTVVHAAFSTVHYNQFSADIGRKNLIPESSL